MASQLLLRGLPKYEYIESVLIPFLQEAGPEFSHRLMTFFIAHNFTGPTPIPEDDALLNKLVAFDDKERRVIIHWLEIDGEVVYPTLVHPMVLLALWTVATRTKGIFDDLSTMRIASLYQRCMSRRSHTLFKVSKTCIDRLTEPSTCSIEVIVECAVLMFHFYEYSESWELLKLATKKSGLQISEAAMLGVRTRWQTFQTAQFVVTAEFDQPEGGSASTTTATTTSGPLPTEVEGEKDGHDLYTRPRESTESGPEKLANLTPAQLSILLAMSMDIERSSPVHDLTREHMEAYVQRALANEGQLYIIRAMGLLLRTRLEDKRGRTAQRSLLQVQQMVDEFPSDGGPHRQEGFFLVLYPSIYQLKAELAGRYANENLYKSALEYYEQLQDWQNIIFCSTKLERRNSVESLARDLLEEDPNSPSLLVALGLATDSKEPLLQAWEASGKTSATAARALAQYALKTDKYEEAVHYFDECLRLNPLFGGDWFVLGCSALKLQLWERAAQAFTRVCQLDPDDGFSWNNLGMVLLRLERHRPAFQAFSQALRFNSTSWHMWQNHCMLAVQLGETSQAINSLRMSVHHGGRKAEVDIKTLEELVGHVVSQIVKGKRAQVLARCAEQKSDTPVPETAAEEEPAMVALGCEDDIEYHERRDPNHLENAIAISHKDRLCQVLGDMTANHPFNEDLMDVISKLHDGIGDVMKAHDYRVRELHASKKENWFKDQKAFERVVLAAKRLMTSAKKAVEVDEFTVDSARRDVTALLDASKETFEGSAEYKELESLLV
eukprot:PhF_6_TR42706/c0_g1_i1/m.64507